MILKSCTLTDTFSCILRSIVILLCCSKVSTNLHKFGGKKMENYSNRFLNDALFIDANRSIISKFSHRKLALSMSSTNVGKNHYRSISFFFNAGAVNEWSRTLMCDNVLIFLTEGTSSDECTLLKLQGRKK